jgi:hypothetical protein
MPGTARPVADSPAGWRKLRHALNRHRQELAEVASPLYLDVPRVGATPLMCRPEWVPDHPIPLDAVTLGWTDPPPTPAIDGTERSSASVRPVAGDGARFPTYAEALAALEPPATFENRPTYRILGANLAPERGPARLDLTSGRYFDSVNVGEVLGHELAIAWQGHLAALTTGDLPFRTSIGDPCDLARRPAGTAITTLTIRRAPDGDASFLLHWRDPAKVAHAGGMYQVIPVGIFQPADDNPASVRNDFSLWRGMVREFSEELLGAAEDYPELGSPLDYTQWPFHQNLSAARQAGKLRVYCLGLGADPLTLAVDILTVAVFDSDVFDAAFSHLVAVNSEGRVVNGAGRAGEVGVPFSVDAILPLVGGHDPMQAAGAATLQLAWRHRTVLVA